MDKTKLAMCVAQLMVHLDSRLAELRKDFDRWKDEAAKQIDEAGKQIEEAGKQIEELKRETAQIRTDQNHLKDIIEAKKNELGAIKIYFCLSNYYTFIY